MTKHLDILAKIIAAANKLADTPPVLRFRSRLEEDRRAAEGSPMVVLIGDRSLLGVHAPVDGRQDGDILWLWVDTPQVHSGAEARQKALDAVARASVLVVVGHRNSPLPPLILEILSQIPDDDPPVFSLFVANENTAALSPLLDSERVTALGTINKIEDGAPVRNTVLEALQHLTPSMEHRHERRMIALVTQRKYELTGFVSSLRCAANAREEEEHFWQDQEARRTGRIGQPGCSMAGLLTLGMQTPGDFALLIHSDRDCMTARKINPYSTAPRDLLFCTNLNEEDIISGKSINKLRDGLQVIAEDRDPSFILAIGSCPTIVSHDPLKEVAAEVEDKTGIPIAAVSAHGLGEFSQPRILDLFAKTLLETGLRSRAADKASDYLVGLLGFPSALLDSRESGISGELADLMDNGSTGRVRHVGIGSSLEDWLALAQARVVIAPDRQLFPRALSVLESRGVHVCYAPPPFGVSASERFYKTLAEQLPQSDAEKLIKGVDQLSETAHRTFDDYRSTTSDIKVGYGIGMYVDFNPQTLASGGLAEARALADYGITVEFLVQGAADAIQVQAARDQLADLGFDAPCHGIRDIATLEDTVQRRGLAAIVAAEHMGLAADKANIPLLRLGFLQPGLAPTRANIERLLAAFRPETEYV